MSLNNNIQNLQNIISSLEGKVAGGSGENVLLYATGLQYTYMNSVFPTGTELEINAPNASGDLSSLLTAATGVKKLVLKGNDADNAVTFRQCFYRNQEIEVVDFSQFGSCKVERFNSIAQQATNLREIIGVFDFTGCVEINKPFTQAYALEEFRIKEGTLSLSLDMAHCSWLSDATVQSIIDGLANLSGQTTQTLTLHTNVGAKLIPDQIAFAEAKNWTLAY